MNYEVRVTWRLDSWRRSARNRGIVFVISAESEEEAKTMAVEATMEKPGVEVSNVVSAAIGNVYAARLL